MQALIICALLAIGLATVLMYARANKDKIAKENEAIYRKQEAARKGLTIQKQLEND